MRPTPAILHLDMDAFYASVEQAAKPSLRGKPVIVGGIGPRGVVATASYEARRFGVRSAMSTGEARRRCPNAAFLIPRFTAYREVSELVMTLLGELSPLVEPLSLDEAFVDLEAGPFGDALDPAKATRLAVRLRADIHAATGLTASVGVASSKLVAKIASEAAKPDGFVVVAPGEERSLLDPLPVRALWGVGPATAEAMRKVGIGTVADIAAADLDELIRLFGQAHGRALHEHARGLDDRPVVAERDAKSISVEDTFEVDLVDRTRIAAELDRLAARCVERLRAAGRTGRTVVVKMRRYDFSTLTRSETLRAPTDDPAVVRETAQRLAAQVDFTGGLRLLGVGVASLADFAQQDLFAAETEEPDTDAPESTPAAEGESGTATAVPTAADASRDAVPFDNRDDLARPHSVRAGETAAPRLHDPTPDAVAATGDGEGEMIGGRGTVGPAKGVAVGGHAATEPVGDAVEDGHSAGRGETAVGGREVAAGESGAPGAGGDERDAADHAHPARTARAAGAVAPEGPPPAMPDVFSAGPLDVGGAGDSRGMVEPVGGQGVPGPDSARDAGGPDDPEVGAYGRVPVFHPGRSAGHPWRPGQDVVHEEHGPGWVQGSGVGRVTVRFETPGSAPGRIRTFAVDDPALRASEPLPLAPVTARRAGERTAGASEDDERG
ncbi:MAG TPA: DNA polymerase IV [Yinghuangia sp.]|nr:DNA polymerase IV [Yinghuangia sp.]